MKFYSLLVHLHDISFYLQLLIEHIAFLKRNNVPPTVMISNILIDFR